MLEFPDRLRHPSGTVMERVDTKFLVELSPAADAPSSVLSRLGLALESATTVLSPMASPSNSAIYQRLNNTAGRYWARSVDGPTAIASRFANLPNDSKLLEGVRWIGPVYSLERNGRRDYLCPLPNVLIIKLIDLNDKQLASVLGEWEHKYGIKEDAERSQSLGEYRLFRVMQPIANSSFELLSKLLQEERQYIVDTRFENMPMHVPTAYVPNDSLHGHQWNVAKIGLSGQGQTGWNIQRGRQDIVIAILDEGCDLNHPELSFASNGINLGSMSGHGRPTGNHGTACAGVAAAGINDGRGVAGVAGGCRILPIAFQHWTDLEVASGIRYAADNGARVISMSFGFDGWDASIIDPAIQYAYDRNVVMCVATHNFNGPITYPATNPLVIACGASDQNDNRKSPASPDQEPWGSNFGPEVSVTAPGVRIPTTDRLGSPGYSNSSSPDGDHTLTFNGTSSATPHVAGLAALLISQLDSRTNDDVRNIIERTASKVGPDAYLQTVGKPNGSWNEKMGYGRIDALAALQTYASGSSPQGPTATPQLADVSSQRDLARICDRLSKLEIEVSRLSGQQG